MSNEVALQKIRSFLQAYYSGDIEKAFGYCDEAIDMTFYAPVEIFPRLGHRHGRQHFMETMTSMLERYSDVRHKVSWVAADGNKVSAIVQLFMRKVRTGRMIQFDVAMFFTLKQGRIVELRAFFDTIDAIQQILGHDLTHLFAPSGRRVGQA